MKLNVIKQERFWWTVSMAITLAGILAMVISFNQFQAPLKPALDFVGGTRLQLELDCSLPNNCAKPISVAEVREVLDSQNLADSSIQVIENYGVSIRSKTLDVEARNKLQQGLNEKIGKFDPETIQIDTVGPTVGKELFAAGLLALLLSFFGIVVYLSFRFQLDYAIFAIVALLHDVMITVGVFAILGVVAGVEVDSLFLVALLTIVGFSVNDTVVIYDRIRENLANHPEMSINDIVNNSVNETLTRTINTTLTTLFSLFAIFLFGGETLKYFALALIVGFLSGAYSTIFIASSLLALWRRTRLKNAELVENTVGD